VGFDLSSQGLYSPSAAFSPVSEAVGSLGRSFGALVSSSAVVEPPLVGFAFNGVWFLILVSVLFSGVSKFRR
jgi:hypothetical protein